VLSTMRPSETQGLGYGHGMDVHIAPVRLCSPFAPTTPESAWKNSALITHSKPCLSATSPAVGLSGGGSPATVRLEPAPMSPEDARAAETILSLQRTVGFLDTGRENYLSITPSRDADLPVSIGTELLGILTLTLYSFQKWSCPSTRIASDHQILECIFPQREGTRSF
jgi:hypothetical protein